jgi:hypothetical protein
VPAGVGCSGRRDCTCIFCRIPAAFSTHICTASCRENAAAGSAETAGACERARASTVPGGGGSGRDGGVSVKSSSCSGGGGGAVEENTTQDRRLAVSWRRGREGERCKCERHDPYAAHSLTPRYPPHTATQARLPEAPSFCTTARSCTCSPTRDLR